MEGETIALEWTYNLHGVSFFQTRLSIQGGGSVVQKNQGGMLISRTFRGRITENITESFASVTFLSINRTDSKTYIMTVTNGDGDETFVTVEIQVQCKLQTPFNYSILKAQFINAWFNSPCFHVPPSIPQRICPFCFTWWPLPNP